MKPRFLLALCLMLAAAPAVAQLVNENLLVTKPAGYKIGFSAKKNNMIISEMVPEAETVENWTEMVTVQIFLGLKSITPAQFKARMDKLQLAACSNDTSLSIANVVENGYPVSVWHMTCPLNTKTGKPEITFVKAIQGNDSFYVVQKAFKAEPSKEQMATWTAFLRKISVCDSRIPERACPVVRH
jgi:hypothetical protein